MPLSLICVYCFSGEKTSGKEWANFLEIKGRVRLEAFEKFLQQLPMSRSRAVMVSGVYLPCIKYVTPSFPQLHKPTQNVLNKSQNIICQFLFCHLILFALLASWVHLTYILIGYFKLWGEKKLITKMKNEQPGKDFYNLDLINCWE